MAVSVDVYPSISRGTHARGWKVGKPPMQAHSDTSASPCGPVTSVLPASMSMSLDSLGLTVLLGYT